MNTAQAQRRQKMRRLVELYATRSCTRKEFCSKHKISPSGLDFWRRKLRAEDSASGFIRVKAQDHQQEPVLSGHSSVEIEYPNGKRIKYSGPLSFEQVQAIL